jgi:Domain of Unknown Function (DUF928)
MSYNQRHQSLILISLLMGTNGLFITPSHAATPPPKNTQFKPRPSPIRWTPPPPPPNLGDPSDRGQGGGSRGNCDAYKTVTALLPRSQSWGLTTQAHPMLWLNLPKGIAAQVPLELVLQDAQGKPLFKKIWKAPETPSGIISIPVPTEAPALQLNQSYRWAISIYCDAENPDTPVKIWGAIDRTALSPAAAAKLATLPLAIDQAALYAEQGVWYDAVTTLGLARRSRTHSANYPATIAWKDLLKQAELQSLMSAPLHVVPLMD